MTAAGTRATAAAEARLAKQIKRTRHPENRRAEFVAAHNGRCHYCNRPGLSLEIDADGRTWELDHMTPLARGGLDEEENLTLACKRCNCSKGVQPYEVFKKFAEMAFWQPSDWQVSEYHLDRLAFLYAQTEEPDYEETGPDHSRWRVDPDDLTVENLDADGRRNKLFTFSRVCDNHELFDRFVSDHLWKSAAPFLHLVVAMRELLPALIAEVRMHRRDAAERAS